MIFVYAYLIIINAVGLVLMLVDKIKAQERRWRIPERTLFFVAFVGGSLGIVAGMQMFRHKTLHPEFSVGVPLIMFVQIIICVIIQEYIAK